MNRRYFDVMDVLGTVLEDDVLTLHGHEKGDCHAVALRASSESISWLPIRTVTRLLWVPFSPSRKWRWNISKSKTIASIHQSSTPGFQFVFFESSASRLPRSCPLWPSICRVVFHRNSWNGSSRMGEMQRQLCLSYIQRSFGVSSWTNSAHNNNCLHKVWSGHFQCLLGRLLVLTFNNLVLICCSLWMCSKTQNTPHAEGSMGPCFHSSMSFWKSSSRNMFRFWSTRKFCFSWVFESDTYVVQSSMCAAPTKSSTWLCLSHKSITHKNILWNRELAVMRVSVKKNKKNDI